MRWTTAAALAIGLTAAPCYVSWAQESTIDFIVAGPADWNTATNWNAPGFGNAVPGDEFPQEIVSISNAGIAQLTSPATHDVMALVIGETHDSDRTGGPNATEEIGTLNVSGAGQLRLVDSSGTGGAALRVGDVGLGILNISGGSVQADTVSVGGAADSALNLSGNGVLAISGNANIGRITRIEGPDVIFDVEGDLVVRGMFTSVITGPTHSPITAPTGNANIHGTLRVEFNGHDPQFGDSWGLIDAGSLFGEFSDIDTSAAPALPDGLQYRVNYSPAAGDASLTVGNSIVLSINRDSGAATMSNEVGGPIEFDGYSILSAGGLLSGAWSSFADNGVAGPGWLTANPSANNLSELNLTDSFSLGLGESLSLGNPYALGTPPENDDLVFQYTSLGSVIDGIVQYIDMPMLTGDTNGDGVVDITDLNNVRNTFGGPGIGDTNGDGVVDITDLNNVRNNFGAMAAVPEPATMLLMLCAISLFALRRPLRASGIRH